MILAETSKGRPIAVSLWILLGTQEAGGPPGARKLKGHCLF